ncbi:MAG: hypothetical protein LW875_11685 [Proteobacteria bacterium]|nr:hypothetical protein [Pseudomonadota bacterium]
MDSGVARKKIEDWEKYRDSLEAYQGPEKVFIRSAINKVRFNTEAAGTGLPRIVFPEGSSSKILKSLATIVEEKICQPILLGYPDRVREKITSLNLDVLKDLPVIHPSSHPKFKAYAEELWKRRQRKGVTLGEAEKLMSDPNYFASMMVAQNDADGLVTGSTMKYGEAVKPVLQTIGVAKDAVAAGLNIVLLEDRFLLLLDTTVNFDPTAEQLSTMALQAARVMEYFGQKPRIAMLSYSNFTGSEGSPAKMRKAVDLVKAKRPDLMVDGDMQADTAVNSEIMKRIFPFCELDDSANILLFPNLEAANIAYKLLQQLGKGEVIGPFLMGVRRSANVLQRTTTVDAIVNSVVLTALEAQYLIERRKNR